MSKQVPVPTEPSRALQWVVLGVALAVIAATVLVVATGPSAGPGTAATSGTTASTPAPSGPIPPDSSSDQAPQPRELAGAVLGGLEPEPTATRAGVEAQLQSLLTDPALGARLGAAVLDPASDELLLDVDATGVHVPASTTKLLTALATLEALGPDSRFRTTVLQTGAGIVLVGGGDPALSQRVEVSPSWDYPFTRFDRLARAAADELLAAGRHQRAPRLRR